MLILSTKTSHHTPTHTCILFPFLFFSSITPIYYRSDLRDRVCADRDQTPVLQSRPVPPPSPPNLQPPTSHHARGSKPESESNSLSARDLGVWGEGESYPRDQHIWILLGVKASPCPGACAARPN